MATSLPLLELAATARRQDATRFDPLGKRLLATVRDLPGAERLTALVRLPFWDRMAVASLFAWNIADASEWTLDRPAQAEARRLEVGLVAQLICRQSFSAQRDALMQHALDEYISQLRENPRVLKQARAWRTLPPEEQHGLAVEHAADFFAILTRHQRIDLRLPLIVMGDPLDSRGDMARHHFDRQRGSHKISQFYGQPWDTLFDRVGCMIHELEHAVDDEQGLIPCDPTVMTRRDHDLLRLSACNDRYGLYLGTKDYGPALNRLQPVERSPWQVTYAFNELRQKLLGIPLPKRHRLSVVALEQYPTP